MSSGPQLLLLRVRDLGASLRFYRDALGLSEAAPEGGLPWFDLGMSRLLLQAPGGEAAPAGASRVGMGETIFVESDDLERQAARLAERGVPFQWLESWWGDRRLVVVDPDGYRVGFWQQTARPAGDTLALYRQGLHYLRETVEALSEPELDLARGPGGWTVRQLVHHLTDTTAAGYQPLVQTLAEPGSSWRGVAYRPDVWVVALDFAGRPVAPALALLAAVVEAELDLFARLPDAWDRTSYGPDGGERRAGRLLELQAGHLLEHLEEIDEIVRALRPELVSGRMADARRSG